MLENVLVYHSSIRVEKGQIIYFDPFKISEVSHDADIIFITHSHYDHYSPEDIDKIIKEDTIIVAPAEMKKEIKYNNVVLVEPGNDYKVKEINFSTIWAYNIGKPFHPKSNKWVGYVVEINEEKYYVAGDTDLTEEAEKVKCDVAFIPCGGMYTMNVEKAAKLANTIHPKIAVPTHYGAIVGKKEDGQAFVNLLEDGIQGVILIK